MNKDCIEDIGIGVFSTTLAAQSPGMAQDVSWHVRVADVDVKGC